MNYWKDCIVHMLFLGISLYVCYLGRLVDCNRSGRDREGDIDWHMSYIVTVRSLNPTQSKNLIEMRKIKSNHHV